MTETPLTNEIGVIESLSKVFAVALGVLYLLGFLVVASYLSRYGVSTFSVLQLQYLLAGIWLLGPPIIYSALTNVSRRFDARVVPEVAGRFNWRRWIFSMAVTGFPSIILLILLQAANFLSGMTWQIFAQFFFFNVFMTGLVGLIWTCRRTPQAEETWWLNRSHAAPFYLAALSMLVLLFAVWFAGRIYPQIPASLGGGKPLTVVFFEGEKKMPDEIQRDGATKRSIPYKLVLSTDKYYVVLLPSAKERSMEVSRDSVAGMIVLE
jgi:hypothetical protein